MNEHEYDLPHLAFSFQTTVESRRELLPEAADRIVSIIRTLPCVKGVELTDLHLALLEALANAVIHGNREDSTKTVGVCGGCDARAHLLIAVTDQGEGFNPGALGDPTTSGHLYSTHGRGVFLMRRLVDEVKFNLGGRQVVLRKRFRAA